MRTASLALFLIVVIFSSTGQAQYSVPILPDYRDIPLTAFNSRPLITFIVVTCREEELLYRAAYEAAAEWNRVSPIKIQLGFDNSRCGEPLLEIEENNIHWADKNWPEPEAGHWNYRFCLLSFQFCEEDIEIDPVDTLLTAQALGTDWYTVVYNTILHELGHSLGLGDAYKFYGLEECGWSVMLALCTPYKMQVMPADIEALQRIYGRVDLPTPLPPPPPLFSSTETRTDYCSANDRVICSRTVPVQVSAGQVFTVTLTITPLRSLTLVALREEAPEGFSFGQVTATPTPDSLETEGAIKAAFHYPRPGQTITLTYELIAGATPGTFKIRGFVTTAPFTIVPIVSEIGVTGMNQPPQHSMDSMAQFDINRNGMIDDAEFFTAIDQWIAGLINDELLFAVIDAWISQVRIASLLEERLLGKVQVYDLNGHLVMQRAYASLRQALSVLQRTLPNGVYILVLRTDEGVALRKIAIVR
jgi:hypothetical protein